MRFKTGQALVLSGASADAFRHWKTVLAPLSGRDGRVATFSLSEVVALAVVDRAVTTMGVPVSRLAAGAVELFEVVADYVHTRGAPFFMFINGDVLTFGEFAHLPECDAIAVVRIDRIAATIDRALSEGTADGEEQLRLL